MSKDVADKAKPKVGIFKRIGRYFKDLKSEFKKIVWPSKKQTKNNTIVVIAFMAVSLVIILALDFIFMNIAQLVF